MMAEDCQSRFAHCCMLERGHSMGGDSTYESDDRKLTVSSSRICAELAEALTRGRFKREAIDEASELDLDPAICWQALNSRDQRFDGRFFAGVRTTRVYCRPICPVPLRKPENTRWFRSAASAEDLGYRPF